MKIDRSRPDSYETLKIAREQRFSKGGNMTESLEKGMVHRKSPYCVDETLERLGAVLQSLGIPVLARIDHSGGAAAMGLEMKPTKLLIFGNAKAGTPLMLAAPTLALDLPLKALVWEDADGKVWVSYNTPQYLQERHGFPEELIPNIAGIRVIVEEAVRETDAA
jgi:uncharacterized protein (DUF302 family)